MQAEGVGPGAVDLLSDFIVIGQPVHESTHDRNRARRAHRAYRVQPLLTRRGDIATLRTAGFATCDGRAAEALSASGDGAGGSLHVQGGRPRKQRCCNRPRAPTVVCSTPQWKPGLAPTAPTAVWGRMGSAVSRGAGGRALRRVRSPALPYMSARRDTRRVRRPQVVHIYGPPP